MSGHAIASLGTHSLSVPHPCPSSNRMAIQEWDEKASWPFDILIADGQRQHPGVDLARHHNSSLNVNEASR